MKKSSLLKWVVVCAMTFCPFISFAQSPGKYLLTGRVMDEAGEPLPGANVYMRGDIRNGTSTDVNGYYSLELPDGKDIRIEASFIGMKTTTIEYIGQSEQDFVLKPDDNMMMEAVVTVTPTSADGKMPVGLFLPSPIRNASSSFVPIRRANSPAM